MVENVETQRPILALNLLEQQSQSAEWRLPAFDDKVNFFLQWRSCTHDHNIFHVIASAGAKCVRTAKSACGDEMLLAT